MVPNVVGYLKTFRICTAVIQNTTLIVGSVFLGNRSLVIDQTFLIGDELSEQEYQALKVKENTRLQKIRNIVLTGQCTETVKKGGCVRAGPNTIPNLNIGYKSIMALHKATVHYVLGIKRDETGKMSFLSLIAVTLPERALLVKLFYESKGNAAAALREFR
ncbi:hypothetical protein TNCV_3975161 [Trichonephila clavipes]|nr:hypothetical protein TNCV_3975161 [Trichonephila clavipes]